MAVSQTGGRSVIAVMLQSLRRLHMTPHYQNIGPMVVLIAAGGSTATGGLGRCCIGDGVRLGDGTSTMALLIS